MKIENHFKRLKENISVIDECIKKDLIERQSTIAFSISSASMHMVEIYLHKNNLIDSSFMLKHEWFKAKNKIKQKLSFDFFKKEEIINLISIIEEKRNDLCYGTPKSEEEILYYIKKFNELKEIFTSLGVKNEE